MARLCADDLDVVLGVGRVQLVEVGGGGHRVGGTSRRRRRHRTGWHGLFIGARQVAWLEVATFYHHAPYPTSIRFGKRGRREASLLNDRF